MISDLLIGVLYNLLPRIHARNHEGYGEDPFLSSQMVYQMIVGLQGNDSKYVRVHADAKHFSAFDGPGNGGSAWISDRDWFST